MSDDPFREPSFEPEHDIDADTEPASNQRLARLRMRKPTAAKVRIPKAPKVRKVRAPKVRKPKKAPNGWADRTRPLYRLPNGELTHRKPPEVRAAHAAKARATRERKAAERLTVEPSPPDYHQAP